jgi:NTE family protein
MRLCHILLVHLLIVSSYSFAQDRPIIKKTFHPSFAEKVGPPHFFIEHRELRRPRIGLALSGGGARALAQVGVLLALEDNNIPIDFIAGTSMGSVLGGLYAAGYSARQLMEITKNIPWGELMVDTPPRTALFIAQKAERDRSYLQIRFNGFKPYIPPALTSGQKLIAILTDLTMRANYRASANFDNLRIPFRAVTTDLFSGKEVVIADGELAEAMRASAAFPLLLAPMPRDSMLLVDGGLLNNIPVSIVRSQNMDLVIAVDATSKLRDRTQLNAPWEIADQVTSIMQRRHNEAQRRAADVLIMLEAEERTSMDFSNIDSLFAAGYRAALEQIEKLEMAIKQSPNTESAASNGEKKLITFDKVYLNGSSDPSLLNYTDGREAIDAAMPLSESGIISMLQNYYLTGSYAGVRAAWMADSAKNSLHIELDPNPVLRKVRFSGNTVFADSALVSRIQSPLGEPINHQRSRDDLESIIELYRRAGYALAEIRNVTFDAATGELDIDIDEGYIAEIRIEGAHRTKPLVILREYPLKIGDIFDSNRSAHGIQNIHSLGLFDRVALNVTRRARGRDAGGARINEPTAIVHIKLQEKPFQIARIGMRYDRERFGRVWFEVGDENFLGLASNLFLQGTAGSRDKGAALYWRIDRLFKTYLSFSAQARYRHASFFTYSRGGRSIGEYEDERFGALFSIGQQVRRFGAVSAELDLSNIQLRGIDGSGYATGHETINTLTFRSVVDTQDRVPFARRGRYVQLAYSMAFRELQTEPTFFKFYARLESTTTLRKRHTLHPRIMVGTSDQTTPFSEQFRIGGQEEMYGLREQELVGRHFVMMSLEYRYRFPTKFLFDTYFSPRIDFGAVWRDKNDVNYKKFFRGMGIALAWDTPLGPMFIAVGKAQRFSNRLYFSLGYRF